MIDSVVRKAQPADVPAIDSLRRAEQEAVGFLPQSRYEIEASRREPTLLVMLENGDYVGYLFWTPGWPVATIQQVVVRQDARRDERATRLVEAAEQAMLSMGRYGVTCRCRLNLEAINFWSALGYREVRIEESGRRGSLMRYWKELTPALFEVETYLRGPAFGKMAKQRRGFRALPIDNPGAGA